MRMKRRTSGSSEWIHGIRTARKRNICEPSRKMVKNWPKARGDRVALPIYRTKFEEVKFKLRDEPELPQARLCLVPGNPRPAALVVATQGSARLKRPCWERNFPWDCLKPTRTRQYGQ